MSALSVVELERRAPARRFGMSFLHLRLWGAIAATAIVIALNTVLTRL